MPGTNLTRAEAAERASVVHSLRYEIQLDLTSPGDTFKTITKIQFSAVAHLHTFLDLIAERVEHIELNGQQLDPAEIYNDNRVQLRDLQDANTLVVSSVQRYTNTGEGLHKFVDPVDGERYLYSQFEVPDSRRVFAVFEQPDLKATFQFSVSAPIGWQVISNQPTPEPSILVSEAGTEIARFDFSPTPVISSYITAIVAGPYHVVKSELVSSNGRTIPLGVYCRKSLSEYLDAEYIFAKTRQGFAFFEQEFKYPYPFEKYDQMFVPEFNAGAMENAGAVTFTEAYVFRSQVTDAMRERRVITILHELAHMWFGDLVTMKWWNDLWLNESFAEFMSTLAVAEATEWTDCWTTFVASEKNWAYRQDQLPSTHPIVAEIRDLDDVLVNFDGITYAKGASVLKQLVAWVGREPFMKGVHDYFTKHQHANTELFDLLTELEKHSGRDLKLWSKLWLESSGVNTLKPVFETDDNGLFTSFTVQQVADESSQIFRPHRIAIGLYTLQDNKLVRTQRIELDVHEEFTGVEALVGEQQPDLILLNDDDLSYAKIRFDERSLQTARDYLGTCQDSLTRSLIWGALWDQTRDAELAASEFIDIVLTHISQETNSTVLRILLQQLLLSATSYVAPTRRKDTLENVANTLWQLAQEAEAGSDLQFQLLKAFATAARTDKQLDTVLDILDEKTTLTGLDIDTDLGWELLISLAAGGRATEEEIEQALIDDNTATGRQSAAHAKAALPSTEQKEAAFNSVFQNATLPNAIVRATGLGFLRANNLNALRPFIERFFDHLLDIWNTRSHAIVEEIVDGFYPAPLANEELRSATQHWLNTHSDAPAALRRLIIEPLAGVERALKAQVKDAEAQHE